MASPRPWRVFQRLRELRQCRGSRGAPHGRRSPRSFACADNTPPLPCRTGFRKASSRAAGSSWPARGRSSSATERFGEMPIPISLRTSSILRSDALLRGALIPSENPVHFAPGRISWQLNMLPTGNLIAGSPRQSVILERLEPYEGKLSRTVLRGARAGDRSGLPGAVQVWRCRFAGACAALLRSIAWPYDCRYSPVIGVAPL